MRNMMPSAVCLGVLLVEPGIAADAVRVPGHQPGEEAAVLAVIDEFMQAISSNDLQALAALQMTDG